MNNYNQLLKDEIKDFRELGYRFLNKEVSVGDFKGKSGGMGVYAQRGGEKFMIRLRTSSGILPLEHLKLIDTFLDRYSIERLHLTTRQAIQLHDLGIDDVCDIMSESIDNNLYTRGGGGNFPRNVSLSVMSGVEKNEYFDVTPFALEVGKYLMRQIMTYKLPRKLKIAFSSSDVDESNSTLNDLGFMATIKEGKPYFRVFLAGGLGGNPAPALHYNKLIETKDILYHVEAMTQLFMAEGDYQNKAKARTRYIPRRMGINEFFECYEKHLKEVKERLSLDVNIPIEISKTLESYSHKLEETDYLLHQRQDNLYTVVVHPLNGQLPTNSFKTIVKFLDKNPNTEARLSMKESIYVRNLTEEQALELLELTKNIRMLNKVQQSVSCIGVPTCQMGIEQSQKLLVTILDYLKENNIEEKYLPSIHISGCQNSCARHQINEIGFAGGKRKVGDVLEDVFDLYVGGVFSREKTELGEKIGTIIMREIPKCIGDIACKLNEKKVTFREFLTTNKEEFLDIVKPYLI
ncbi:nitrite/sulfite reductase [Fusobacterium perfoetens]|uniref:nitrite/sulfite reductase n=1 Tax=Fusobacterium perfoetens TaxID=852 RepID=UPI00047FA04B|nr:nitrite/sulfite reductase [Fusobacterium perfoetens]